MNFKPGNKIVCISNSVYANAGTLGTVLDFSADTNRALISWDNRRGSDLEIFAPSPLEWIDSNSVRILTSSETHTTGDQVVFITGPNKGRTGTYIERFYSSSLLHVYYIKLDEVIHKCQFNSVVFITQQEQKPALDIKTTDLKVGDSIIFTSQMNGFFKPGTIGQIKSIHNSLQNRFIVAGDGYNHNIQLTSNNYRKVLPDSTLSIGDSVCILYISGYCYSGKIATINRTIRLNTYGLEIEPGLKISLEKEYFVKINPNLIMDHTPKPYSPGSTLQPISKEIEQFLILTI